MKNIIAEVEDDFHYKVKMEAMKRKVTIKQYVVGLIEKDLKERSGEDAKHSDF